MTVFEMKEKMFDLQNQLNELSDWMVSKAADPTVPMEELNAKKAKMEEIKGRIEILKTSHDEAEEAQRKTLAMRGGSTGAGMTEEQVQLKAKADFYRAALTGGNIRKAFEGLGAIPTGSTELGSGENLLPTSLSRDLIVEPGETNSLRSVEPCSQITGLEEPKLLFTIVDENLADVTDRETAKEIEMEGDTITYGRHKTKVSATIKDTVLHGSDLDLVNEVEKALRSGLAIKEKINAFRTVSDGTHDHMSFYLNGIKEVEGEDIISAIINAWADLSEAFTENACVIMRQKDYFAAIQKLANNSNSLWGKKPQDIIGIPVIFNDRAVIPVVGDFHYSRQNYDIGTIFETDKNGKAGEYYFILTAWGDHRIRLKSAFRLAKVASATAEASATSEEEAANP